ncbi:hypothetical protein EYF80_046396 [Liparis tanakae]|uniref:Uncharacterized protein n=1 Tax=Liparis tanakae TaxID=230148 RepID=A0A4Z2FQA0_9TELE|nr:hypothetical protein EYF80_046396 [Liparis tanakae]
MLLQSQFSCMMSEPESFTTSTRNLDCSYLVIPIPGPPIPIPPPAAAPLTGFTCCPAPGPVAGPTGITDPIIPAAPGSPGCPPPSMLASFPISVSAQETGERRRKRAVAHAGSIRTDPSSPSN